MVNQPHIGLFQLYGPKQPPDAEPLSIEILAGAIWDKFNQAQIYLDTLHYLRADDEIQLAITNIKERLLDVIGISIPQSTYELSLKFIGAVYGYDPHAKIILGHALPTYSPEIFLSKFPGLIIVRGWGEESLVKLVDHIYENQIRLEDIPNLCYLVDAKMVTTPIRWPEKIKKPYRVSLKRFFPRVEASRGCHHDICTFCTRPPHIRNGKPTWIRRDVSSILADVVELTENGNHSFTFTDEDFVGSDIESALEIAQALCSIEGLKFSFSVRPDNIINPLDSETEKAKRRFLFQKLLEAGLFQVFVGIESLSNSQLKRYGKKISAQQNILALQELQGIGIGYEAGFILFDPLLTQKELTENIQALDKTGLWQNIGQIYNHLRPQKDSAYIRILDRQNISGEFDPDMISYNVPFSDQIVGEIYRHGLSWLKEFDPIYLHARFIRNNSREQFYTTFIYSIRLLQFQFLKFLVTSLSVSGNSQLVTYDSKQPYDQQRREIINNLYLALVNKEKTLNITLSENELKEKCYSFLFE